MAQGYEAAVDAAQLLYAAMDAMWDVGNGEGPLEPRDDKLGMNMSDTTQGPLYDVEGVLVRVLMAVLGANDIDPTGETDGTWNPIRLIEHMRHQGTGADLRTAICEVFGVDAGVQR